MRKPLKSLVAATGAAIVMTAGFAAPALAAPADHMGTSEGVTVDRAGIYQADMTYTLPSGDDTRVAAPWSCGLLRVDGWGGGPGNWRLAVGASYDMPSGVTISLPAAGPGWTIDEWTGEFPGYGNPAGSPALMNTDITFSEFDATYPAYTYMAAGQQQERVHVTRATEEMITIQVDSLTKGEYFNLTFPTTVTATSGTVSNTATVLATCETPDTTPPSPQPTKPALPAPDKDKHIKKVNSGGVEEGGSGLIALGLGAVALGGLAVYGRRRSNR